MARFFAILWTIVIAGAVVAVVAMSTSGYLEWKLVSQPLAAAKTPMIPIAAAALVGALAATLVTALALRSNVVAPLNQLISVIFQSMSLTGICLLFAVAWFFLVIPIAAWTRQLGLLPMTLSLPAAAAAVVAAKHTSRLLEDGQNRLELRHDIIGIGGGLGGWRLSPAAAAALLTVILAAGAGGLAIAGLRAAEPPKEPVKPATTEPNKSGSPDPSKSGVTSPASSSPGGH